MSLKNKILQPWFRFMAGQLSKPHGILAKLTGKKMNESNHSLYRLTLDTMQLTDTEQVLEIGFGNGKFFPELHAQAKDLKLYGVDLSHEMVTEAVKTNTELFEKDSLKVSIGDSNDLPFPDNYLDKVFCINVIYFWEVPEDHLNEIHRVLKPGGHLYCGFRPAETMLQLPFTRFGFRLYDEKDWKQKMKSANFTDIRSASQIDPAIWVGSAKMELGSICISGKKTA